MTSLLYERSEEKKKPKKPMRSTLVVSRSSDVPVDICVAYRYRILVNKAKRGAGGMCTMVMDGWMEQMDVAW